MVAAAVDGGDAEFGHSRAGRKPVSVCLSSASIDSHLAGHRKAFLNGLLIVFVPFMI